MELFGFDISIIFSLSNLMAILIGTFVGMLIGALPGLGAAIAIVLLLPLSYGMEPLASILMLLATYQAAEYGGSISSIMLGIPGTPAAAATLLDGNRLARKSSPGKALAYSLSASTIGGIFGGLVLIFFSLPLSKFALVISDPEFFLIGLLGLIAVAGLSSRDTIRSFISVVLGLMAGTVGQDLFTGENRFTLGQIELMDGISLVALLVGMFAFSELFKMVNEDLDTKYTVSKQNLKTNLTMNEFKSVIKPKFIGSTIGSVIGIFPGLGSATASWFAYSAAKRYSKKPETFGQGNPEGIAAPESANNATVGGALVPLLTLGIPGSPATAIIMGAFIIHGIQPGPKLFSTNVTLVNGIFYGFLLTTIAMFIVGKFITPVFARVIKVPNPILIPIVLVLSIIGIFVARNMFFDIWFGILIGILSFILVKLQFSLPSFILGFILCPIIEESLRRALLLSNGSYSIFITRPYSIIILCIILIFLIFTVVKGKKN